jgi:hypothetical protein
MEPCTVQLIITFPSDSLSASPAQPAGLMMQTTMLSTTHPSSVLISTSSQLANTIGTGLISLMVSHAAHATAPAAAPAGMGGTSSPDPHCKCSSDRCTVCQTQQSQTSHPCTRTHTAATAEKPSCTDSHSAAGHTASLPSLNRPAAQGSVASIPRLPCEACRRHIARHCKPL